MFIREEKKKKKNADGINQEWLKELFEKKSEDEKEVGIKPINSLLYPIISELQNPIPDEFVPEIWSELTPEEIAGTPEGKKSLEREMKLYIEAMPPNTEIGIRVNPKTGNPEIYARGKDIDYSKVQEKMTTLLNKKVSSFNNDTPPTKEDYQNGKTNLSEQEQGKVLENFKSISKDLGKSKSFELANDIEKNISNISDQLKDMGLKSDAQNRLLSTPNQNQKNLSILAP